MSHVEQILKVTIDFTLKLITIFFFLTSRFNPLNFRTSQVYFQVPKFIAKREIIILRDLLADITEINGER